MSFIGKGLQTYRSGCPVPGLVWTLADGSTAPVRCGASNRCDYCARKAALESALVSRLDAEQEAPTASLTTTTHRASYPLDKLREAERYLWRDLRAAHPEARIRYLAFLEWTTGRGGKGRMPHVHHLVKGLPAQAVASGDLEREVRARWRRHSGGAFVVECRPLRTPAGAIAYLALHHHKPTQAPPPGHRNVKRLRPSKGYFGRPVPLIRRQARRLLLDQAVDYAVRRALGVDGVPSDVADDALGSALQEARARRLDHRPELCHARMFAGKLRATAPVEIRSDPRRARPVYVDGW